MKRKLTALLLSVCLLFATAVLPSYATGAPTETLAPSDCDELGGGAYTAIYESVMAGEEKIDISSYRLSENEAKTVFETVYYSEAELFFISAKYNYTISPDGGMVGSISPTYLCEKEEIPALLADFYERTDAILADAPLDASAFVRVAYVHDFIARNFIYDYTYTNHDVYSMLVEGAGVCQPYSLLARYLLRRLGVETECVTSEAINHEWNVVRLGGEWYHMDITWDDADDTGFFGQVWHEYFLCSDAEFMRGDHASEWVSPVVCDDTSYDGDFAGITSAFVCVEDALYVIWGLDLCEDGTDCDENPSCRYGDICRYDEESGALMSVYTIDEIWHTYMENTGWLGIFSGLAYLNGKLLYNTERELCYYEPETGESGVLDPLPMTIGYVYGMEIDGDDVVYALKVEPNDDDFKAYRMQITCTVTWMVGGTAYEETYFYDETPVCKVSTDLPEDTHRFEFIGWDKAFAPVTADVTYTAVYTATQLYSKSAVVFLGLVADAGEKEASLAERYAALSGALAIRDEINPSYEGVGAAKIELASLISAYDTEAAALFVFAGWVPKP